MELSRTVSSESARAQHLLASGNGHSPASRKARSSEPETDGGNVERASVSMPPPANKGIARQFSSRRLSRASDISQVEGSGPARNDEDPGTALETSSRLGYFAGAQTLALPDTAFYRSRSDPDADSNRLSLSSLYSLGSVILSSTRGMSGPGSVAGSEPEGKSELCKVAVIL
jgi:inositol hexakisphosphate/diphosphoinositol-pentakisphosphate kinase